MPDQINNDTPQQGNGELTPGEFLASMETLFKGLATGRNAQLAANANTPAVEVTEPNTPVPTAFVSKAMEPPSATGEQKRQGYQDPLCKAFNTLSALHPSYGRLATKGVMDDPYGFLSQRDGSGNHVVTKGHLDAMMQALLTKGRGKEGVPLGDWIARGGQAQMIEKSLESALREGKFDSFTQKALDTALAGGVGGGALVRTDIEPILYEAYLRDFPASAVIRTFPANGVVHSYDVRTGVGAAVTVSELGDIVTAGADANSTIERRVSSNIAIIVSRRGISLKLQFAVPQSGMNFPMTGTDNLEVVGGITAVAKKNQSLLMQGNFSTAAKTLDDEEGLTDANGYDGLRTLLKGAGTSKTFAAGETHRTNLNKLIAQISNAGGNLNDLRILLSWGAQIAVEDELEDFVRIMGKEAGDTGIPRQVTQGGLRTFGNIISRFLPIPAGAQGEGTGYYTIGGTVYEDLTIVDPQGLGFAYLGSPTPVILELPVGFDNKLQNIYIIFLMNGLVCNIPAFHRKYRIPRQTL